MWLHRTDSRLEGAWTVSFLHDTQHNVENTGSLQRAISTYHEPAQTIYRGVEKAEKRKKKKLTGVASLSLPAIFAFAEEVRHQVSTCPSIMTGVGAAVIYVWLQQ